MCSACSGKQQKIGPKNIDLFNDGSEGESAVSEMPSDNTDREQVVEGEKST